MSQYNHILLTIDFSEYDEFVAQKAKDLAQKLNAELSIIHILDDIPMPGTPYGTVIPLNEDSSYPMLEAEKTQLKQMADQLSIAPTKRWLVWGEAKQEIALFAEREKIDLIIVGSHGRHGIALLLGSTANGVLHHAKCDVLAVRLPD